MLRLIIPVVFMLFISCKGGTKTTQRHVRDTDTVVIAKPPRAKMVQDTAAGPVAFIRKKVEYINTARLTKKHFEFMCDEKMMVDYFFDQGHIVKIAVDYGTVGDVYARESYYYNAGKLIFMYEFVKGGPACKGCIQTHEYRSYIGNNKVFKYLKDAYEEKCRTCQFSNTSKQYKLLQAQTPDQMKFILCGLK